jgi:hypothetical protein
MNPEIPMAPDPSSAAAAQQLNDLFDSVDVTGTVDLDEFKHFLDHLPVAVIISKILKGEPRMLSNMRSKPGQWRRHTRIFTRGV